MSKLNVIAVATKSLSILTLTCALGISLTACQKNDSGGGSPGTVATTPQVNCNIPGANPASCNPGNYNQYGWPTYNQPNTYGTTPWSNGFCGCPAGYVPVMNAGWGFGCAPYSYGGYSGAYAYMGWSSSAWSGYYSANNWNNGGWNSTQLPPVNGQQLNIPMSTYSVPGNFSAPQNNCYQFASQSCDVRMANSCGPGGLCVAAGAGSSIGICQYVNSQTGTQSGCRNQNWNGMNVWVCSYNWSTGGALNNNSGR